ncbi:hypothetical protein [Rhodococcus koreensis]
MQETDVVRDRSLMHVPSTVRSSSRVPLVAIVVLLVAGSVPRLNRFAE